MVKLSFIGIGEASTIMPVVQPIMDVIGSVKKEQASTATNNPARARAPRKGQTSVTLPDWVVEKAGAYLDQNREELEYKRIKTLASLISHWILENVEESQSSQE